MWERLEKIRQAAVEEIKKTKDIGILEELRVKWLGRKGELTELLRGLGKVSPLERPKIGQKTNEIKREIEELLESKKNILQKKEDDRSLTTDIFDITLPGRGIKSGHLHPLTRTMLELEDYFGRMGYMIYETDNLTNEYDNFVAVNIPADHPARGMVDTFWVKGEDKNKGKLCMAAHTTSAQNRILRENKPPYKAVALGRCFRREATDATHEHTFYQIEGVVVDKELSVANLKKTLLGLVQYIIGKRVPIRLRPSYFPFVEPGFEVDVQCWKCLGKGCGMCKSSGWIELLGAGMIHQNVFVEAGYKRNEWTGFAYGSGYDRFAMIRYGINDIRYFYNSEPEFIEQF